MSGSQEDDPQLRQIVQGEYQLVDLENLKGQIRASKLALLRGDSPLGPPSPLSSPTHSTPPQPLGSSNPVQLPLSSQHPEAAKQKQEVRGDGPIENTPIRGFKSRHFSIQNQKQIEDVMYQQVGGTSSHVTEILNRPSSRNNGIYWSRFVPRDIPIPQNTYIRQTAAPPRAVFSHPVTKNPPALIQTMPVVRRLSPERAQNTFINTAEEQQRQPSKQMQNIQSKSSNQRQSRQNHPAVLEIQTDKRHSFPNAISPRTTPERTSLPRNTNNKVIFFSPKGAERQRIEDSLHPLACHCESYQRRKDQRANQLFMSRPRQAPGALQQWHEELWVTAAENRLGQVNNSPTKSNQQRYLSSENKKEFKLNGIVQHRADYIQEGKLKQEYLSVVESRRRQIHEELQFLRPSLLVTPQKTAHFPTSAADSHLHSAERTRKKIFSQLESTQQFSHIEDTTKKPGFLTPKGKDQKTSTSISKALQQRKQLFSDLKSKAVSKQLDTRKVKAGLTGDRIKIFRSKQKQGVSLSRSPKQKKIRFQRLRLSQMPGETRRWYEVNSREIAYQVERIGSYDLIRRYMQAQEINARLNQLLKARVEPRRWCLTMVDQVYQKLKDRYLAV